MRCRVPSRCPGLTELRIPTNLVLIGGRTYTANKDDYAAVHALQDQYKPVPLSEWGKAYTPPDNMPLKAGVDDKTPVPTQVLAISPDDYFNRLNALLVTNPPEPPDPATMARIAKLGIASGASFSSRWAEANARNEARQKRKRLGNHARHGALWHQLPLSCVLDPLWCRRQPS